MHNIKTLLGMICAAACCATALAQSAPPPLAWKWRDASGQIVVSDTPPPRSVSDRDILERPPVQRRAIASAAAASAAASAVTAPSAQRVDPELEARRRRAADEQLAQQRQQQTRDAALRAENCARAKDQLQALADGQRMARTNAQGEREVLDDKARAEEMQRMRTIIASDCR